MNEKEERRTYSRYTIPVVIDAPDISELPLVPEDVSVGGFRVIVKVKPEVGDVVYCNITVFDERFNDCYGRVAWTGENDQTPGSWVVGIRVDHADSDIGRLNEKLKEVVEEIKAAS